MPNWSATLRVADLWAKWDEGELTSAEVATALSERLEKLPFVAAGLRNRLTWVERWKDAGEDAELTQEEFNSELAEFYDWCDAHRVWLDTFSKSA